MEHDEYAGKGGILETTVDSMALGQQVRSISVPRADIIDEDDGDTISFCRHPSLKREVPSSGSPHPEREQSPGSEPPLHRENESNKRGNTRNIPLDDTDHNMVFVRRTTGDRTSPAGEKSVGRNQIQVKGEKTVETAVEVSTSRGIIVDLSNDSTDEMMDSEEDKATHSQLESLRIQREIKQIELEEKRIELQELQLKQKLAARKKSRHT